MSSKSKIEIEKLRVAVNVLLEHLSSRGIDEVELGKDYYWEIGAEILYDVSADPSDFVIGSLFEDWESIQKVAVGESEPVVLLLLKIAPLLRYIGDSVTETQLSTHPRS